MFLFFWSVRFSVRVAAEKNNQKKDFFEAKTTSSPSFCRPPPRAPLSARIAETRKSNEGAKRKKYEDNLNKLLNGRI